MAKETKKLNSVELRDAISQLSKQGKAIVALAKSEVRDLTEDEEQQIEDLKNQIEEKKAELEELKTRLETMSFDEDVEEQEETKSFNKFNTSMEKKKFSLLKAVNNIVNGNTMDEVTRSVVSAGQEEARKAGINTEGQIQIPMNETRAFTVADNGDTVETDVYDILGALYAKNVLIEAGAKVYSGLRGNVSIPVLSKANVDWQSETGAATDAAYTTKAVTLSPKRLTAYVDISNMMLTQDSVGVENAIKEDIINAINAKLEETLLGDGAATTTKPQGILNGITPSTISDFQSVLDNEAVCDDANVANNRAYIMSNKMKSVLRGMTKGSKSTQLVMENGEVDGTKAYATSNVSGKQYIYGDFSNYAIGMWGNIDIKVDPYTQAINGCTRLVVNFYVDAAPLRSGVFAAGKID